MEKIIYILILQLLYVPMLTMRTIFMVKSKRVIASLFGVLEATVYIFGLALVLKGEQNFITMTVYAIGFGLGILLGNFIEQKLAIGYNTVKVNLINKNIKLIKKLREKGFGVTVFEGEGNKGKRYSLEILTNRHKEKDLIELIEEYEPNSFIITYEPKKFKNRSSMDFK
jgi:uncharacterized protein YebE (UPF0316 family)